MAEIPNDALEALAADAGVAGVHLDRPVGALLAPGAGLPGPRSDAQSSSALDFTGAGVGVAVIDSGLTSWHDDLARVDAGRALVGQRVVGFADFTSTTTRSPTATVTARTSPASSPDRVTTARASTQASRRAHTCWC